MKWTSVNNYAEMSQQGAERIFKVISKGGRINLGLATGNTMLELYRILADMINTSKLDISNLHTWNLDEYVGADGHAVAADHPLSYHRYMNENFFSRLPGFNYENAHFPDPENPAGFDTELAESGGLTLQLLGIGFNGHIAFNEPMSDEEISVDDFAALPTRIIDLAELTIATNRKLTAEGQDIVPRQAVTMGMKQILAARQHLLLACFAEQAEPLNKIKHGVSTPAVPASFLLRTPDCEIIYTADRIQLS